MYGRFLNIFFSKWYRGPKPDLNIVIMFRYQILIDLHGITSNNCPYCQVSIYVYMIFSLSLSSAKEQRPVEPLEHFTERSRAKNHQHQADAGTYHGHCQVR